MTAQTVPPVTTELTLEGVATRQQQILEQLAFVITEQETCSEAVEVLKGRVITKDDMEDIIGKRLMTKQDFATQRAIDEKQFEPLMKQLVTRRWLAGALTGLGCCISTAILLGSGVTVGAVILISHFFSL